MDDLERNLIFLKEGFGDEPNVGQRHAAIQYLLDHAEAAYPRILADLQARPAAPDAPALIQVLPQFRREHSVAVLEAILAGGDHRVCRAAGEALGRHESPRAFDALMHALGSGDRETRIGAAIGLGTRGDMSACDPLAAHLDIDEPVERYYLVQALAQLGCDDEALWSRIEHDPDPDIRALAVKRKEEEP